MTDPRHMSITTKDAARSAADGATVGLACAVGIVLAAMLIAKPAEAVTFDFAAMAQDEKIRNGTETPFPAAGWTVDGLTVFASTDPGSTVWMDGAHGRAVASGLGACDQADCNGHWRDGITNDESVTLTFDRRVRLASLFLRESSNEYDLGRAVDHTPYSGAFSVNDIGSVATAGLGMVDQIGTSFTFRPQGDWISERASGYLSAATVAPIPLPATALLLLGGLAGLAMVRRARG